MSRDRIALAIGSQANTSTKGRSMITRLLSPVLLLVATSHCLAQEVAVPPEAKPYIGTWAGEENPQLSLPAPRLKIRKDGTGASFLGKSDKPLYEFKWKLGEEDDLQAAVNDGEGSSQPFFARTARLSGNR